MPVRRARQWIASSRILVAVSVALAGATLVALRAQGPARPAQPAFRTGTTLIEVSAIATRGGEVVTDLRADEVVVRIAATPVSDADGPKLADEVLAAVAEVSR